MFKLIYSVRCLPAHEFDGILVTEIITALYCIKHMPFPAVLFHITERGCNTTLCGPGELIDVIVTERGIAINPLRTDLLEASRNSGLPVKSLEELKAEADRICGLPAAPELEDRVVAAIKWVDGTVIDAVRQVSGSS